MIYIIGHKKPDLDSIASSIALAEYYTNKKQNTAIAVTSDPINTETKFILEKFKINTPQQITAQSIKKQDRIILVDHNETDQRLENINPKQIIQIIDHHKANIDLQSPITINIQPLGSTCTILWQNFAKEQYKPSLSVAGIMLSGILSDTVGFKSQTTTPQDQKAATEIAKTISMSDADINRLTIDIFNAKSNVGNLTSEELITNDYKIYDFAGKKVFIGQLETTEQENIIKERIKEILLALDNVRRKQKLDFIFFAISDILKVNTKLITKNKAETEIAEKAFRGKSKNNILDIGAKLSRKKQIAPAIEQVITN